MQVLTDYSDWRKTWTCIIPGKFSDNGYTDLLLYDSNSGHGDFYTTNLGNISLLKSHTDWRKSWTLIIPGNFAGSGYTDLLFYGYCQLIDHGQHECTIQRRVIGRTDDRRRLR